MTFGCICASQKTTEKGYMVVIYRHATHDFVLFFQIDMFEQNAESVHCHTTLAVVDLNTSTIDPATFSLRVDSHLR